MGRRACTLLGVSLSMIAAAADAQTQPDPVTAIDAGADDAGIGEIVVTAQKRRENLQDVPISISAVTGAYLESRGITSIDRLAGIAPNVKFERAPSNRTVSQISIRGSVTINPAITWEPAVGLYLDGVYIAKAQGSIFDVADLERVEVLRGPQGTLYGRNALAGAVNLVTRKPSGVLGGSAQAEYGDYGYWRARASLDLPALGPLLLKFSGQVQRRDGFVKVVPNPFPQVAAARPSSVSELADLDSISGMAQARLEISDALTADYSFDYARTRQRPDYSQLLRVNRNGDPRDIFDPASPAFPFVGALLPLHLYANPNRQFVASVDASPLFERSRTYGHALTLTLDAGAATLKSITAYRDLDWSDSGDLDGSPLDLATTARFTRFHAFSQELQATGAGFGGRLNYVAGAFYYREKAETLNPQRFFGGASIFQSDYGSNTEAWALYAQLDYRLTDALKLTLGGRYTEERKDIRRFFAAGAPAVAVIDLPYGGVPDARFSNFSPSATLSYAFNRNINAYARFAKGFKSGGFNGETNVFFDPGAPAGCPFGLTELCEPYRPEKVDSYELGLKSRLLDGSLILNIAAFRNEHADLQLSIFTAAGAAASVIRNAAAARVQGLEIEAVARPTDALTVNASVATLDARYKRFIDGGADVSDNRAFPHTPRYTANLGVDWRVIEGDWGNLSVGGDMNFVSAYFTFPYPLRVATPSDQNAFNSRSPGRTIVNARATVGDLSLGGAKAELGLWARNLTNEQNPSNFIDFGPSFGGLTLGYFPDPRTYGLNVGIKF